MKMFADYASYYDLLYQDKNYKAETNYVSKLIKRFLKNNKVPITLLDLACGTGKHALCFSEKGFLVEGSDISSQMIQFAKKNNKLDKKNIKFYNYSFQESDKIQKSYDVVISMFSSIDYLINIDDINKSLRNINSLLKDDGIFIFDYWNGNAVVKDYSPLKVLKKKSNNGNKIIRISKTTLDVLNQLAIVKFECMFVNKKNKMFEFEETHKLRYFYFSEIQSILESNGFRLIYRGPFMKLDEKLNVFEWNISIVAKKIKHSL